MAGFAQRGAAFQTNTLAQRSATEVAAEQGAVAGMPGGQEFANNAFDLAKRDIEILQARGEGRTGNWTGIGLTAMRLGVDISYQTNAATLPGLQATRMAYVVRDQWNRFVRTLDPKTRSRNKSQIDALQTEFEDVWRKATLGESARMSGTDKLAMVQAFAAKMGSVIEAIQKDALDNGETPGVSGAQGLPLPANQPKFGETGAPLSEAEQRAAQGAAGAAGGTSGGATGASGGGPSSGATGAGSGVLNSAGAGSPSAVNYNISVGTLVSQGGDELDLPGRLGVPDLG
jgi:hypothetical protein